MSKTDFSGPSQRRGGKSLLKRNFQLRNSRLGRERALQRSKKSPQAGDPALTSARDEVQSRMTPGPGRVRIYCTHTARFNGLCGTTVDREFLSNEARREWGRWEMVRKSRLYGRRNRSGGGRARGRPPEEHFGPPETCIIPRHRLLFRESNKAREVESL